VKCRRFRSAESIGIACLQVVLMVVVILPIASLLAASLANRGPHWSAAIWLSVVLVSAGLLGRALRVSVTVTLSEVRVVNPLRTYRLDRMGLSVVGVRSFPMTWLPFEVGRSNRALLLTTPGRRPVVTAATGVVSRAERRRAWAFLEQIGADMELSRKVYDAA
jgi:hypothetical protein